MTKRLVNLTGFFLFSAFFAFPSQKLFAASLPGSAQEIVKKLKLDPAILSDVDGELEVPKEWVERARKEGKVRIASASRLEEGKDPFTPFKQRYPFIALEYSTVSQEARVTKPLVAFRAGRSITDIITGVDSNLYPFREANALEYLGNLPAAKHQLEERKMSEGLSVDIYRTWRCIGYNTRMVKKENLPHHWEDLLTNPIWRGGNLALANRPGHWASAVWKAKGETWTKDFLSRLFREVKPQLRKEGLNSLAELLGAGEFYAVISASAGTISEKASAGAPVGFVCPEPVPTAATDAIILKGATNINSARIFLNWLLCREGQITQYFVQGSPPVHRDLQRREFIPFAEGILGKKMSYIDEEVEVSIVPKLAKFWEGLWLQGGRAK